jgi:phage terminase large subunit-like protein
MRLRRDGVGLFRAFNQGGDRLVADKRLYDSIRDRRIVHQHEPVLAEHIANANQKNEGDRLRIVKRNTGGKIDAVVALSMAVDRAFTLNIG